MIEILNKSDNNKITDKSLIEYLQYSFNRLPKDYIYPDYGYFIVAETFNELVGDDIKLADKTFPSLTTGLYDNINMVELNYDIMEILVFVDTDTCVSFIVPVALLDEFHKSKLLEYVI